MRKLNVVSAILGVLICMPIWFFLLHRILEAVNASELMWFLYWVYVPVSLAVGVISRMLDKD